jgi:hypothetical protein
MLLVRTRKSGGCLSLFGGEVREFPKGIAAA